MKELLLTGGILAAIVSGLFALYIQRKKEKDAEHQRREDESKKEKEAEYQRREAESEKEKEYNELLGIAYSCSVQKEYSKAIENCNEAANMYGKTSEKRAMALWCLGVYYHHDEKYDQAISYYKEAIAIFDQHPLHRHKIAHINDGYIALSQQAIQQTQDEQIADRIPAQLEE